MRKYTHKLPSSVSRQQELSQKARIVAIGASAGGLDALKSFFKGAPGIEQNAYVVIQHLSPDYKSMMSELLKKSTELPIVKISDGMEILPGHVYLIPPANNLILKDGLFQLTEKPKNKTLNLPIDIFFESLAEHYGERAIGIVLSGTGSDGTRGARSIKEKDGMVMVQEPKEAQFDGMPQSVIGTGLVDYILPAEKMGAELERFIKAPAVINIEEGEEENDHRELMKILRFVFDRTGLDFKEYKYATLARRVSRRVNVRNCNSLAEYYNFLVKNDAEVEILYHEFLIGVTKFFRDPKVWEILRSRVIPEMIKDKQDGEILKVWDVACSTGEEAYSFAMCLYDEMDRQGKNLEIKIFATDISEKHLEKGSKGCYPESIAADVPQEFLAKYFVSSPESYRIVEKLRRSIVFSRHNIIGNPPFSNMDLVVCRNLLIYFQTAIQEKALNMLHYALKPDGILVLGTSESVYSKEEDFTEIDRKWKIYRNTNPQLRLNSGLSSLQSSSLIENRYQRLKKPGDAVAASGKQKYKDELVETVLESLGGASLVIDKNHNILEAVGEFRKFAGLPGSGFSVNLLDMLAPELRGVIQNNLKKSRKRKAKVFYGNAVFHHNGEQKAVDIIVKPILENSLNEPNYAVIFIEKELHLEDAEIVDNVTPSSHTNDYVSSLEEDLKQTKEELQTSLDELETSNEELRTTNEELLTSNEELQSTNEELQSVNEEIITVNAENIQKMEDLEALNSDMNNILASTQIGTIFLDLSLNIRKFTPAISEHFSLIHSDLGRPITHFTDSMGKMGLSNRCKRVIRSGETLEKLVVSREGTHYLRRISPYRGADQKIKGVVITFIDVETLQKSKEKLMASERRFKSFYEEDPVMHISVDPATSLIVHCNAMAFSKLGYQSKEELVGLPLFQLYSEGEELEMLTSNKDFQQTGQVVNVEQELRTKSGENISVILNATAERDEEDNILAIRYTCVDISDLKKAEEQLRHQKSDLERANRDLEQFVSICTHDLQQPLATIKFGSDVLGKVYGKNLDEKGRNYISYIKEASNRLSSQIKALLEHSRIGQNGKKELVNTVELIEVVKHDLGKIIKDTGAEIYAGSLPSLRGYEVELRLLFQNLISNAIKYTPEDRNPVVRISAYKEGEYWFFSVVDNGQGIPKEDLKNIFTIFNRVNKDDKKDGTGVGLAHVEKIVLLHNGSIWVDSQEGVGSTFHFKLKS